MTMTDMLQSAIEYELNNPVLLSAGNESLVGVVDLGASVADKAHVGLIEHEISNMVDGFVAKTIVDMDWTGLNERVTASDFYNVYDLDELDKLWDAIENVLESWTGVGGINSLSLEKDAESAVGLTHKNAQLDQMYVILMVWPAGGIQDMTIHVLAAEEMVKCALEGRFNILTR